MNLTPRAHGVLSYGGALVAMPLAAHLGDRSAGWLPLSMWAAHFLRRVAECLWLHRYSKPVFPWTDVIQEDAYYWGFAVWIGATLPAADSTSPLTAAAALAFVAAECGNALCHRRLAALRPQGGAVRSIPQGRPFVWVSSPHYLFEILAWASFLVVVRTFATVAFWMAGAALMTVFATQRHRAYLRQFPDYPARRRILFPFLY